MGLDVNLYAQGEVSDAELEAAVEFFADRGIRGEPLRGSDVYDVPRIEIDMNGARYYGIGYERGPWVEIHAAILATIAAFPNCTVHYGSDGDWDAPEVDQEQLNEIWAHFLSRHGDDYHREGPSLIRLESSNSGSER